jgi:hypothetical protein
MNFLLSVGVARARPRVLAWTCLCALTLTLTACGGDSGSRSGATSDGQASPTGASLAASTPPASGASGVNPVLHCAP